MISKKWETLQNTKDDFKKCKKLFDVGTNAASDNTNKMITPLLQSSYLLLFTVVSIPCNDLRKCIPETRPRPFPFAPFWPLLPFTLHGRAKHSMCSGASSPTDSDTFKRDMKRHDETIVGHSNPLMLVELMTVNSCFTLPLLTLFVHLMELQQALWSHSF